MMKFMHVRKHMALEVLAVLLVLLGLSGCSVTGDSTGQLKVVVGGTADRALTGTASDINLVKVYLQRNGETYSSSPSPGFYPEEGTCINIDVSNGSSSSYLISDLVPANDYSLVMVAGISGASGFEPVYYVSKKNLSVSSGERSSVSFSQADTKTSPLEFISASPVKSLVTVGGKAWMLRDSGVSTMDETRTLTDVTATLGYSGSWASITSLGQGTWFGETGESLWLNSNQGIFVTAGAGAGALLANAVSDKYQDILFSLSWVLNPADTSSTHVFISLLDGNIRFAAASSADQSGWNWIDLAAKVDESGLGGTIKLATFLKGLTYGDGYIIASSSLGSFLFTNTNIDYLVNKDWSTTTVGLGLLDDPNLASIFAFPNGVSATTVDARRNGDSLQIVFGTNKGLYTASHDYASGTTTAVSPIPGTQELNLALARISGSGSYAAAIESGGNLVLVDLASSAIRAVPAQAGVPAGLAGMTWLGDTLVLAGKGGVSSGIIGSTVF